ncbi:MAG: dephospho-CoA kinase [Paludibacteraceae bacterium]|nr:dephospho-CoA kinase [Paludibacteraceae bacterium]
MKKAIGITGGIGSGKSVVSSLLRILNIPVYDADAASKSLLSTDPDLVSSLKRLLGEDIYEGDVLNRKKMASMIFSDKELLAKVNALIHPAVISDFRRWAENQGSSLVACESALIYESKMNDLFDAVLMVYAPEQVRIKRAIARDAATEEQIRARIQNQMSDEQKKSMSDFVVLNDDEHALIPQLQDILDRI